MHGEVWKAGRWGAQPLEKSEEASQLKQWECWVVWVGCCCEGCCLLEPLEGEEVLGGRQGCCRGEGKRREE